ncbi:MAG: hypothetical protein K2L13_01640 [Opitutales bacterium]|nr:hypothetical protein [Opitutales bacterium]
MASWIKITIEDLYDYLISSQVDILRKRMLADKQGDPLADIITDITARIRAEISGNTRNVLSSDKAEIPPDLKSAACYLIMECAQSRIPALKLTEDQVRLANDAREYLRRIAQGEIPVSAPDSDIFSPNKGVAMISHRERTATGNSLKGL